MDKVLGLTALLFTAQTVAANGTGGEMMPQYAPQTGVAAFITVEPPPSQEELFFTKVRRFKEKFGLDRAQTATLLRVTRPTLNTWLKGTPDRLVSRKQENAETIINTFDLFINQNKEFLGVLLRWKMDKTVKGIMAAIATPEFAPEKLRTSLERIDFRLEGMVRSNRLSESLKDKKPII